MAVMKSTMQARKNSASCLRSRPRARRITSSTITPSGQKIPDTKAFLGKSSPTVNRQKSWHPTNTSRYTMNKSISLVWVSVLLEQQPQKLWMLSSSLTSSSWRFLGAEAGWATATLGLGFWFLLVFIIINIEMYLPSLYKVKFEKYQFNLKRAGPFAIAPLLWLTWSFWPNIYNTIYTDIIPPPRGVQRRIVEEE